MIGEHTLYRKIQVILDIAKKGKASTIEELTNQVFSQNLINFKYKHFDKKTEEEVTRQSQPSISRAIVVCTELGLISEKGKLTSNGIKANNQNYFDAVLSQQIVSYLQRNSITIRDIRDHILALLHSSPPVLPTAKALWESLQPSMRVEVFSLMLTLLAQSQHIIASRSKIYIGFRK